MRILTVLLLIFNLTILSAQDTLRVMHYNLLYYGNSAFCSENNNNTDQKDAYLRAILTYTKPDIVTVNEMSYLSTFQQRLLSEVMNQTGYALFDMAQAPNTAQESIVNQLYYNTEKLALHSQAVAQNEIRDIDVYYLYSLNVGLQAGDTVFLNCVVAHLKAGDDQSDENDRAEMTENTLNYLEAHGPAGNYLFMGDFNFQESSEEAFQMMTGNNDPVFRFYDPANEIGDWHNNSAYRYVHTQSTRSQQGGCGAWGGMDDRFDFIMMNKTIHDEDDRIGYIDGTYWALGQDGQRFNGSISDPPNTSLPAYIIDALYGMSDHLPVVMDLVVDEALGISKSQTPSQFEVSYNNPVTNQLRVKVRADSPGQAEITLVSLSGIALYSESTILGNSNTISIPVDNISSGMYLLKIRLNESHYTGKVIIIR